MKSLHKKTLGYATFLLTLFLLCGCNVQKEYYVDSRTLNIDTIVSDEKAWLSSIYESVKVIPIDNSEVTLSDIVKMQVSDNFIYVLDKTQQLYMFNNDGRFLRKIGNKGGGLGEYTEIADFTIDHERNYIYALEFRAQAIYTYDLLTGKFVESVRLNNEDYLSRHIQYSNRCIFTDLYSKKQENKKYLLRKIDLSNRNAEHFFLDSEEWILGWNQFSGTSPFYPSDHSGFYFIPLFSNVVFEVGKEQISPAFSIKSKNLMNRKTVQQIGQKGFQELISANKIYEMNCCIIRSGLFHIRYMQGNVVYTLLSNQNRTGIRKVNLLLNDLLFNKENEIILQQRWGSSDFKGDYYFLNSYEIPMLMHYAKEGYLSPSCCELSDLSEDTNPIILYYSYKH